MIIASVVDRIRARCGEFTLVGGAAQLDAAMDALTTTPAAFVLPARDTADENPFALQMVQQLVNSEFSVVLVAENVSDTTGSSGVDTLSPVRDSLRAALLNWAPADGSTPCEYVRGELATFGGGQIWWTDTFRTSYLIRSE